jgi:membrane protease YdiL (CAAX protease family)
MGAFVQRLVFTLILFRLIEEFAGSWSAMVAVALIFGFAHIGNENATVWTSVALVISDGILMAAAYMLTRRIWLVWGLHAGWNYFQDGIFGMPNSGITSLESWLNPAISGPAWLTGGSFGIEASVLAVLLNLGVGLVILKKAIHNRMVVQPVWKRRPLRLKL